MVRCYYIDVDTKRGDDVEYSFRNRSEAEAMYDSITDYAYKSLKAYDDKVGDVMIKNSKKEE